MGIVNATEYMQLSEWTAPPSALPSLGAADIHVWRFSLEASPSEEKALAALLSPPEHERAAGIRLETHQKRYIAGHGKLRQVLARYVEHAPEAIEFGRHPRGKPFIVATQNTQGLHFNFSHTADIGLVAVALKRPLGVDVEQHRSDTDMELIARRQFAPGERSRLMSLPTAERRVAFYECWTRKEAYLKAIGDGIAGGLQGFEVSFLAGEAPALLRTKAGPEECKRWVVVPVNAGENLSAACIVERPIEQIYGWDFA